MSTPTTALRKMREHRGLSRAELARRSSHGYDLLSKYELNYCTPSLDTAQELAGILRCDISDLWPQKFPQGDGIDIHV